MQKVHGKNSAFGIYLNGTSFNSGCSKKDCCILFHADSSTVKKNCAELYKSGDRISGVYTIDPDGAGAFDVFCDQTTAGGGWTMLQKRLDGSVNFYRDWNDYKHGFSNLNGEFWLGLDKIHRLTKTKSRLRVDLEDTAGKTAYAEYHMFAVTSERAKYQLSLGTYSGNFLCCFSFCVQDVCTTEIWKGWDGGSGV